MKGFEGVDGTSRSSFNGRPTAARIDMTCGLFNEGRGSGGMDWLLMAQSDRGLSRDHEGLLW